jgi:subtilase family serine protease
MHDGKDRTSTGSSVFCLQELSGLLVTMCYLTKSLVVLLSLASLCSAGMVLQERVAAPPNGFVSKGAAPASNTITIQLALASNNMQGLQEKLLSISDPASPEFRQWLTQDQVCCHLIIL